MSFLKNPAATDFTDQINVINPKNYAQLPYFSADATGVYVNGIQSFNANGVALNSTVSFGNTSIFYAQLPPYNAVGNGVADDTAAIQGAINAAQTAGGGIVELGSGTYKVTSSLTISADNITLHGSGKAICTIQASANTFTPLIIGTLSDSTNIFFPEIQGVTISASGSATITSGSGSTPVFALQVWGVAWFAMDDVILQNGGSPLSMKNTNVFNFNIVELKCSASSSYAAWFWEGAVADCTIGTMRSVYFNTVANNQICLRLDEEITGTANEFNRLHFDVCKFGGTKGLTGNIAIQFIAGIRGSTFTNCAFQYNTAGQFDFSGFDPGAGSYHAFFHTDHCSFIGTSGTPVTYVFYAASNNNINITCTGMSVQNTTNVFYITANAPNFVVGACDFSVTNIINCTGGSPQINFTGIVRGTITGAAVTGAGTPVIVGLQGRKGSMITASKGSGTILASATSGAVTFSTALAVTPSASDININFTGNPGASIGGWWISSPSTAGFTLNVFSAPSSNVNFSYKCNVS